MIINLKIVRVNSEYCDYLRKYDNKIAYNFEQVITLLVKKVAKFQRFSYFLNIVF